MSSDVKILLVLGAGVLALAVLTEVLARRRVLPTWLARKILHVGAVGACAVVPALLSDLWHLKLMVALIEPLLLWLVASRRLLPEENGRRSWGIALFPLAYLVLLSAFSEQRGLIVLPMGVLALSDALAAVAGTLWARRYFQLTGDRKSLLGSATFAASVPGVVWLALQLFPEIMPVQIAFSLLFWAAIVGLGVLLAALEALGSRGWDNVLIPLVAAMLFGSLLVKMHVDSVRALWLGLAASGLFIWLTVRRGSLSLDGAVMASVLGIWVLWFAGPVWLVPLFFFFGSSIALGKMGRRSPLPYPTADPLADLDNGAATDAKHGRARDWKQVLCNGGLYAALATASGWQISWQEPALTAMVVSLAISTADTWASEVGLYFRWPAYDVLRWRRVPAGLSGGITLPGTLAGLMGASALALLGAWLLTHWSWEGFLGITLAGFSGMLLDSVLGATMQARYQETASGMLRDAAGPGRRLQSGWTWMTNDAVNLWSNLAATIAWFLAVYS